MNYVRTLFDSVNAMLSAEQEPRRTVHALRENDPSLAISIEIDSLRESGDEGDCYYDDGDGNDDDDDNNENDDADDDDVVSLSMYQRKAESFLGRPLEWISDLLFSMQRFKRGRKLYWIMDISHPLARIIEGSEVLLMVRVEFANHKDMVQVVYQDALVGSVVDIMAKRFASNGIVLRKPASDPIIVASAPPPTSSSSIVVVKAEGGKKMD